jgi:hypothetical protein
VNLPSANVEGADTARLATELAKFRGRIRHL